MKMNYAFCPATRNKYMIHPPFPHNWVQRNTCKMGKVVVPGDPHTGAHRRTHTHAIGTQKVGKQRHMNVIDAYLKQAQAHHLQTCCIIWGPMTLDDAINTGISL